MANHQTPLTELRGEMEAPPFSAALGGLPTIAVPSSALSSFQLPKLKPRFAPLDSSGRARLL